jgi:hypothetical protein
MLIEFDLTDECLYAYESLGDMADQTRIDSVPSGFPMITYVDQTSRIGLRYVFI